MKKTPNPMNSSQPFELVAVEDLHEDPANARTHPSRNMEAIKASLSRFGQQKPIVVGRADKVVVAGNGTLRAARELGWKEIGVIWTDLLGSDRAAFAIADNRTAELAEWDYDTLRKMFAGLDEPSKGATGFNEAELGAIFAAAPAAAPEGEPVPQEPGQSGRAQVITGDVNLILPTMPEASFDAVLCDPPYGLSLMGKEWDRGVPSSHTWREVLRVLKPGGSLLAFGGTRTYHRLTSAIEDAGFEVRDCLMWLYGSGFPKSLDIAAEVDALAGGADAKLSLGQHAQIAQAATWRGRYEGSKAAPASAISALVTAQGRAWAGYGTALKPAWEPCIHAMKPNEGTFAQNAMKHGVAGINVGGNRVDSGDGYAPANAGATIGEAEEGRWPANVVLDAEAAKQLDEEATAYDRPSRFFYIAKPDGDERSAEGTVENAHPTLKPIDLARHFASLLLPPQIDSVTRILVPFSGSGSEMIGAVLAGWDEIVGVEISDEYAATARARLRHYE